MDLSMFYLAAAGIGLLGCLSAVAKNGFVNKVASICHIAGIVLTVYYGWRNFSVLEMLGAVLTIFLVGMICAYIILKIRKKK